MGGIHSVPTSTEDDASYDNEGVDAESLIRQGTHNKKEKCMICFDMKRKGILCSCHHFICDECFSPYVSSVIENGGKLADGAFQIHCPVPDCSSRAWKSNEVRLVLSGDMLDRYVDALVVFLTRLNDQELDVEDDNPENINKVINCLTLGCPECKLALDPTPDGCAAMRCVSCGVHFCFLCFEILPTSPVCHLHVSRCVWNPSGRLFPSQFIRESAHKALQIKGIREVLERCYSVDWRSNKQARQLIRKSKKLLQQSGITEQDVFPPSFLGKESVDLHSFMLGAIAIGLLWFWCCTDRVFSVNLVPQESVALRPGYVEGCAKWVYMISGSVVMRVVYCNGNIEEVIACGVVWSLLYWLIWGMSLRVVVGVTVGLWVFYYFYRIGLNLRLRR